MDNTKNKEEFINFLLNRKHGIPRQEMPIGLNHIRLANSPILHRLYEDPQSKENILTLLGDLKEIVSDCTTNEDCTPKGYINDDCTTNDDCTYGPTTTKEDSTKDLIFAVLNSNPMAVKLLKDKQERDKFPEVVEWYKKTFEENKKYLKEFNSPPSKKKEPVREAPLKEVVTRFPPEPSGFLHIGHAKAALVNVSLAEKGKGRLILRFDDTNPDKKYEQFEEQIIRDLQELQITNYKVSHSSDYFSLIIDKARLLIKAGLAYCDNTDQETMKRERMDGIESKNRKTGVSDNLDLFERMLKGEAEGYCLRAKIDMKDNNKAMRDPVIFRSTKSKHYRVGEDLHAFPTYDFTCPILDSIEGVTLACRANEYRDRNPQYYWFIENLHLENRPEIFDFSRLNFENTVLSKRKINELIGLGCVSGWDDPRLATIQGIKRAGMDMNALREYILLQGASQKTSTISWDKVWAMNKKAIDPKSPRFMCVPVSKAVTVKVEGIDRTYTETRPLYKKNPALGEKTVVYDSTLLISQEDALVLQDGEEFTLMGWGNAIVVEKKGDSLTVRLNLQGDYKKTKNKISWISKLGAVVIRTYEYGNILKDSDAKDLYESFNWESIKEEYFYAEPGLLQFNKKGSHVQFERIGFFYCDEPYIYNLVPFTKQKRTNK